MGNTLFRAIPPDQASTRVNMWYFEWEYLVRSNFPGEGELDELKAWLRSQAKHSDTVFTRPTQSVKAMRAALQSAVWEISLNLDPAIETWVKAAHKSNIEVEVGEFFATRDIDWNDMTEQEINEMSEGKCIDRLYAARDEVAWLVQELSRLARYTYVEEQLETECGKRDNRKQRVVPATRKKDVMAQAEMSQEL